MMKIFNIAVYVLIVTPLLILANILGLKFSKAMEIARKTPEVVRALWNNVKIRANVKFLFLGLTFNFNGE